MSDVIESTETDAKALTIREQVESMEIKSDDDLQVAAGLLKQIKGLENEVKAMMQPVVAAAHAAHKKAKEAENEKLKPLQEASAILGRTMATYQRERERQLAAEREAERKRAFEEAEAKRLAYALELEAQGKNEAVEMVLAMPTQPEVSILPEQTARVAGTQIRETWRFEVIDAAQIPRGYLIPDEQKIGGVVRAMKGETNIPGVRVWCETKTIARAV